MDNKLSQFKQKNSKIHNEEHSVVVEISQQTFGTRDNHYP